MSKVACVFIHGMGRQKKGYSFVAEHGIKAYFARRYPRLLDNLLFAEVLWSHVLEEKQQKLFERLNEHARLDYQTLRHFFIHYLGDVVAYSAQVEIKKEIFNQISSVLRELIQAYNTNKPFPLLIVAHSLGSVITIDYLANQFKLSTCNQFVAGRSLAGLVTMGSPLALWSLAYPNYKMPAIFPGPCLEEPLKSKARWINFYDQDDVLAFPLRGINAHFSRLVSQDVPLSIGSGLSAWNPLVHTNYWQDTKVHRAIARVLIEMQLQVPAQKLSAKE